MEQSTSRKPPQNPRSAKTWWNSRRIKLVLFLATFLLASAPWLVQDPRYIVFFPLGLFVILLGSRASAFHIGWLIAGWFIYASITIWATFTTRRLIVVLLYVTFVILLITNLAGCLGHSPP